MSMKPRLTREVFIERARGVHGDKYDYFEVKYVNTKTKVRILCPIHGVFLQTPEKHMAGQGCPDPECTCAKLEATNLARYGVRRPLQNGEIHAKVEATNVARYGVRNPTLAPEIRAKQVATCREIYGTDYSCAADSVRKKRDATLLARYGGRSPFSSPVVRERAAKTLMAHYHVDNAMRSPEVRAGLMEMYRERYGTDWPLGSPGIQELARRTKLERGTFNSSSSEEELYGKLCSVFGSDCVIRQYRSVLYPFACDFYIKPRDMYVELNASWTHGGHWFEGSDPEDAAVLDSWKVLGRSSRYYGNAVHVWAERDVLKRETARKNALNYIVFWDYNLKDANLWFSEGCPDGHDYERPYSWLDLDARPVRNP